MFKIGKRTNDRCITTTSRDTNWLEMPLKFNTMDWNGEIIYLLFINMAICMLVALYRDR